MSKSAKTFEIEAKLKPDSLQEVRQRLEELNATFIAELRQLDSYFDDKEGSLRKNDCCLRVRKQTSADAVKYFLTYKGAKVPQDYKKRQEIEAELGSDVMAKNILCALGYNCKLAFEKSRQLWELNRCQIALDRLPLIGFFVEIEAAQQQSIREVQTALGLSGLKHIAVSYAELLADKLESGPHRPKILKLNSKAVR